jgi:uroporphyrinogen decarboxylase
MGRIRATLQGNACDRVPVFAQVFGHAAVTAGVPLQRYLTDGATLARCQLHALERYGYDAVFALMDVCVESEALGSRLNYRESLYPTIERYALSDPAGVRDLAVPDPRQAGRMPEMLKALELLRRELGDRVLVTGGVLGPMTLAGQLMGLEKALFLAIDHPDLFAEVLDFGLEVVEAFALAQLEAGAHLCMVFDPAASQSVIPPQMFREFELPRLARLFSRLKSAGSLANWLHIAGPIESICPYYRQAGVEIANVDYCNDLVQIRRMAPGVCLNGNLKPLSFVEDSPREIAEEAAELLRLWGSSGGFILSPGCEVPLESRGENIDALVVACRTGAL